LRRADVTTANLEGAVASAGVPVPGKEFHFEGPAALLNGARTYAGLDLVTLANNHVLDYGAAGLRATLVTARAAGIATVGAGGTIGAARRPAFIRAGGLTVAFLGYSDVNPYGFVASAGSPGTARADTSAIAADVRAARRKADLVVCWFHWGSEGQPSPNGRQQVFAAAALNAGATLVLGAHPHVLGRVVRPTRTSLVAWTLGNFVFPAASPATSRTAILLVALTSRGVSGFRLVPAVSGVRPLLAASG
jgi:poly-gamma-glutamate synthesis protein (capsule biosynthesis protein)